MFFTAAKTFTVIAILLGASIAHSTCALSTEKQPQGIVGLQLITPGDARAWSDAEDLGVTWIRAEVRWNWIEPYQGQFDSSYTEKVFALASAHPQMRLLVIFNHAPQWAIDDAGRFPEHAAAAATWLMKRHGQRINAIEVFNEQNLPGLYGWPSVWRTPKESAQAYAKTLTAVSSTIRELNKSVFVVTGGLSPARDPETYMRWMIRSTPPTCFDAIGGHPYGEEGRFQKVQRNAAILLEQENAPGKILWFTEYGTTDNAHRSDLLASLAKERHAAPITFFFADQDIGWFSETYGLRTKSGKAKPGYAAFGRLMQGLPP